MLTIFCLCLAWGMIASLLILPAAQVHPRFFRVQYLIALGLLATLVFFPSGQMHPKNALVFWLGAVICCIFGSIVWSLDKAPYADLMPWATMIFLTLAIGNTSAIRHSDDKAMALTNAFTSAALLGSSMSAMLMGHSYLVAPAMSLTPLMRLLAAMGLSLVLRVVLAAIGLFQWTDQAGPDGLDFENVLWLSLRWAVGFVAMLILGWMAWESARIRSTQSATGILYVVVIVCFLGELTSQFLTMKTGFTL